MNNLERNCEGLTTNYSREMSAITPITFFLFLCLFVKTK